MCNFYLKNKKRYCKRNGVNEGYCTMHFRKVQAHPELRAHPVLPRDEGLIIPDDTDIPVWVFEIPEEEKVELTEVRDILVAQAKNPSEHLSNLRVIFGDHVLKEEMGVESLAEFECKICYMDDIKEDEVFVFEECKHYYCTTCLKQMIKIAVRDNDISNLKCPHDNCDHKISFNEVRCLLSQDDIKSFQDYEERLFNHTLNNMSDIRYCQNKKCGSTMCGSKVSPMMTCPDCSYKSCFNCKEEWHEGFSCRQRGMWKEENKTASTEDEKWIKKNTKKCPKCKVSIQRSDGCNHMKCLNCKYHFHWVTLVKWRGYKEEFNVWGNRIDNPGQWDQGIQEEPVHDQVNNVHNILGEILQRMPNLNQFF